MRILLLSFFLICFLSVSAFGHEIYTNELCGGTSKNNKPCHYVKELNFHLEGSVYGNESFNVFSSYLDKRVAEINEVFNRSGVKAKFKPFTGSAWVLRPKEKDSNIEMTFLFSETPDKKFIMITFYSFSKWTFYINTGQCPLSDNDCVIENMRNVIDEIVIKSMDQDGN